MAHRVQISRAWCDECLSNCWFSYDEATTQSQHLGTNNATKWQELKNKGYQVAHNGGGVFTFTLWKAAPLALPLDWQMAIEAEPEYLVDQDW